MDNNYIRLSTGDVIQTDDIIHVSKPFYPSNDTVGFSILYAGHERVVIEYKGVMIHLCEGIEEDLNLIYEKIGLKG